MVDDDETQQRRHASVPEVQPEQLSRRWLRLSQLVTVLAQEASPVRRLEQALAAARELTGARAAAFVVRSPETGHPALLGDVDPGDPFDLEQELAAAGLLEPGHGAAAAAAPGSEGPPWSVHPVLVAGEPYATLCAAPSAAGAFGPTDHHLLQGLAEQLGVSIRAADALAVVTVLQGWLDASAAVRRQLLTLSDEPRVVAAGILEAVRRLTDARTVTLVGPSPLLEKNFQVRMAAGVGAPELLLRRYPKAGSLAGEAMERNVGLLTNAQERYCHHSDVLGGDVGSVIVVPFEGVDHTRGAILASRAGAAPPFTPIQLALTEDFARQSSLALELADSHAARQQLRDREGQDEAARAWQDDLIQRLFGLGVAIQALRAEADPGHETPEQSAGWARVGDEVDAVIAELRERLTSDPDAY